METSACLCYVTWLKCLLNGYMWAVRGGHLFGPLQEGLELVGGQVAVSAHELQAAGEAGSRHARQTVHAPGRGASHVQALTAGHQGCC